MQCYSSSTNWSALHQAFIFDEGRKLLAAERQNQQARNTAKMTGLIYVEGKFKSNTKKIKWFTL
jgi:hypothetical protein